MTLFTGRFWLTICVLIANTEHPAGFQLAWPVKGNPNALHVHQRLHGLPYNRKWTMRTEIDQGLPVVLLSRRFAIKSGLLMITPVVFKSAKASANAPEPRVISKAEEGNLREVLSKQEGETAMKKDLETNYPELNDFVRRNPDLIKLGKDNPALIEMAKTNPKLIQVVKMHPELISMAQSNPAIITVLKDKPVVISIVEENPWLVEIAAATPQLVNMVVDDPGLIDYIDNSEWIAALLGVDPVKVRMEWASKK
mmetsp:Transcript_51989/g.105918  ORF Transcript_51989/g.105918 Transcript_51989/m.105918 type:complete len:253 (+) Transcript_51989:305-1063(+)